MSSINISIRKEAYDFLRSLKTRDKSFSEVILEFKKNKGNKEEIIRLVNMDRDINKVNWKEKEERMKDFRESFNKRIESTIKYMREAGDSIKKRK